MNKPNLYLVVLGGRFPKANIELHDVRWVIGNDIKDTIPSLKQQWFGPRKGLHIDSFVKVSSVDQHWVILYKKKNKKLISNYNKLWFVNLGGYKKEELAEQHQFGLVVAPTMIDAKNKAKRKWLRSHYNVHKDDIDEIVGVDAIDNCLPLDDFKGWNIELLYDKNIADNKLIPDWNGYWRID